MILPTNRRRRGRLTGQSKLLGQRWDGRNEDMLNILGVGLHRGFGRTAQRRCGSCLIAFSYMFLQGVFRVGFISLHGWRVGQQMSAFDICSARDDGMGWRKGDGFSDSWSFVSVFIFPITGGRGPCSSHCCSVISLSFFLSETPR